MAKLASIALILTLSCLLASTAVDARKQGLVAEEDTNFLRSGRPGKGELVKLHFYVHDVSVTAPNTTSYDVATASITATSTTKFGTVRVVDTLVTAEPDPTSRALGRLQGIVTKADLTVLGIAMNVNIYFTAGKYSGSTLSVLGRNQFASDERELVVAGGTGAFRFASGYVIQSTYSLSMEVAVLEFYVYTVIDDAKFIDFDDVPISEM